MFKIAQIFRILTFSKIFHILYIFYIFELVPTNCHIAYIAIELIYIILYFILLILEYLVVEKKRYIELSNILEIEVGSSSYVLISFYFI